ncbi:MAG: DNA mismatch repair endonuclease MutL [Candidatus Dojkabacteria bacterium]|nr:MAG: DNA mismatch repair endonuclease MutL [Candidatus Dojkabacteria bacterium]
MKNNKIKILEYDIINKIAAGEVIERPASVIKEAIENSLDAGADKLEITLENGGLNLIEIKDNGSGMDEDDAKLAFVQHATSKITAIEDLNNIHTLGFRGEALASIASISQSSIHTYDSNSEPLLVKSINSKVTVEPAAARSRGTTLTVRNIFHNVPARKKFMRSEKTELRNCLDTIISSALANPKATYSVTNNGRTILDLKSTKSYLTRTADIFKFDKESLIQLSYDGPEINIYGYIGHPSLARTSSNYQYIYVNNRPVTDKLLNKAVKDGFQSSISKEMRPCYFIFIEIASTEVDVNVHPRKSEVRFANPGLVFLRLKNAVAGTLEQRLKKQLSERINSTSVVNPIRDLEHKNYQNSRNLHTRAESRSIDEQSIQKSLQFTKELLSFEPTKLEVKNFEQTEFLSYYIQVFSTYIITQRGDKLLLIDQHAADERIKYEQFFKSLKNDDEVISSQDLLVPIELELTDSELISIEEQKAVIEKLGFKIERLSSKSWQLTAYPVLLGNLDFESLLREIISQIEETPEAGSQAYTQHLEKVVATMACHGSIRAGQQLHSSEIEKLINDLFNCELPYSCPHGRPIIWELSKEDLEKQFKRR